MAVDNLRESLDAPSSVADTDDDSPPSNGCLSSGNGDTGHLGGVKNDIINSTLRVSCKKATNRSSVKAMDNSDKRIGLKSL